MQNERRLTELRDKVFAEISLRARKKEFREVLKLAAELQRLVSLISRIEEIDNEVSLALKRPPEPEVPMELKQLHNDHVFDDADPRSSAKARGKQRRLEFVAVAAQRGIQLQQVKGVIYKTPYGQRVGIAYADERRTDKWFLGLPADHFQHAVLLCESAGRIRHFSLNKVFVTEYGRHLFRKEEQVKFNVFKDGDRFYLRIPRHDSVAIDPFRDNFYGLIEQP